MDESNHGKRCARETDECRPAYQPLKSTDTYRRTDVRIVTAAAVEESLQATENNLHTSVRVVTAASAHEHSLHQATVHGAGVNVPWGRKKQAVQPTEYLNNAKVVLAGECLAMSSPYETPINTLLSAAMKEIDTRCAKDTVKHVLDPRGFEIVQAQQYGDHTAARLHALVGEFSNAVHSRVVHDVLVQTFNTLRIKKYNADLVPWCKQWDVQSLVDIGFSRGGGSSGNGRRESTLVSEPLKVRMLAGVILWPFESNITRRMQLVLEMLNSLPANQVSRPSKLFWHSFGCPYLEGVNCFVLAGPVQVADLFNICTSGRPCNPVKCIDDFMRSIGFRAFPSSATAHDEFEVPHQVSCHVFAFDAALWNRTGYSICKMGKTGRSPQIKIETIDDSSCFHSPGSVCTHWMKKPGHVAL